MDNEYQLFQIALILFGARVFAEIATRLRIPTLIGEVGAGIILGPSILGWVEPNEVIRFLAEIGIIMLLFEVGLETDFERLVKAGGRAAKVALGGFVLPFVFGFSVCYLLFDLSLLVSLFVGGTLTATSIGITVRILADLDRHNSREGQIVLGAAVLDDILGVILLAVLYEFATTGLVSFANATTVMLFVGVFVMIAPIAAKSISFLIQHMDARSSLTGVIPALLVSLVLCFAGLAHIIGAPELLGGFAAGVALSRRFFLPFALTFRFTPAFSEHIQRDMGPIIRLFTPIFFVMVGLSMDLRAIDWTSLFFWVFSLTLAVLAILGKLGGAWLIRESRYLKFAIGMAMVPRGEVGLIFAELGRTSGIFNDAVFASLVIVIAYTTLLSPFWIRSYYKAYGDRLPLDEP